MLRPYVKSFIMSRSIHYPRRSGFVVNVMLPHSTHETMILSVFSRLASAIAKLNTIVEICKYRKLHERHHFISMGHGGALRT